jgi:putative tricarboxylic transport membrane protein
MYGFQVGPVILGMILGPLMERSYRQTMLSDGNDVATFFTGFFTTPVSAVLLFALVMTVVTQTQWWQRMRGRK